MIGGNPVAGAFPAFAVAFKRPVLEIQPGSTCASTRPAALASVGAAIIDVTADARLEHRFDDRHGEQNAHDDRGHGLWC